eukprot:NODE_2445_length_1579_cov_63.978022_g2103_i0.p1 GENE.NODE_2445_length_1579_cov_63.978022_g2103_i0~~NODE_2445_length_1579_cov_63.978022_g2103_i0.p1  ORF type:complete len:414 (-),score=100.74 NODE_2445_length_1579_cov_63.978022_g2103_i0:68-1309(-)
MLKHPYWPHVAIMALAKLLSLFYEELSEPIVTEILKEVINKIRETEIEIRNAGLRFAKLALKIVSFHQTIKNAFEACLPQLAETIFICLRKNATGIRSLIRSLMDKCIKRFGYERMLQLAPEDKKRYVRYVEKLRATKVKQKIKDKDRKKLTPQQWAEKYQKEFKEERNEDNGPEKEEKSKGRKGSNIVMRAIDDEPENLLEPTIIKSFHQPSSNQGQAEQEKKSKDDHFELSVDPTGRIVISDTRQPATQTPSIPKPSIKTKTKRKRNDDDDEADDVNLKPEQISALGVNQAMAEEAVKMANQGFNGPVSKKLLDLKKHHKKKKTSEGDLGTRYRSTRAGGDMMKANAPDPHAYIPLSAKYSNKRMRTNSMKRFQASGSFANVEDTGPKQTRPRSQMKAVRSKGGKRKPSVL